MHMRIQVGIILKFLVDTFVQIEIVNCVKPTLFLFCEMKN